MLPYTFNPQTAPLISLQQLQAPQMMNPLESKTPSQVQSLNVQTVKVPAELM